MSRLLYDYKPAAIKACEITGVTLINLEIKDERDLVLTWEFAGKQHTFTWVLEGVESPDGVTYWMCGDITDITRAANTPNTTGGAA